MQHNNWLIIDVKIVRQKREFPAEVRVDAKLMSSFEIKQFSLNRVELFRLLRTSEEQVRSCHPRLSAYGHIGSTSVCGYGEDL